MNNKGLFDIVCNAGASDVFDVHPHNRTIAYESGCYIVLWDLDMDKKLMIHPHDFNVTSVKFCGPENEYIISLDCNHKPSIYITEWQTLTRLHQLYLPVIKKNRSIENYQIGYSARHNILIICENYREQHQFSLWDFRGETLNLLMTSNDENQGQCIKIEVFDLPNCLQFAIVEKRCVKYWRYQKKSLELLNRIHVKDDILDSEISPLTQFFLFITKPGKLVIINSEGQYVSSLAHPQLSYCCLSLYNDYILLGTLEGEIEIYLLSSMKYVKSLKNLREAVSDSRKALKSDIVTDKNMYKFKKSIENDKENDKARQLKKIAIGRTSDLMALFYSDKNIFFYDFQKAKVLTSVSGHSDKIKQVVWSPSTRKTFVTCSNDGTIRVWNYTGDRWESYPIYPPSTIVNSKNSNTSPSKTPDFSFRKSTDQTYKITSMQVDWTSNEIYAGDNKGAVIIYDLASGQIKHHHQIGGFRVSQISLGTNFFGVAFSTGYTAVFEKLGNMENSIKLEEPLFEMAPKSKCKKGITLIDDEHMTRAAQDKYSKTNSFIVQSRFENSSQLDKSYASELSNSIKGGVKQRVITTHNVSSLRLHQIYKSQGSLTSIVLANYYIEGRIVDYEIHPSNDYLLVLSNEGYLNIFKMANGELRGRIQTQKFSSAITLDPSGLYAIVASPYINKLPTHLAQYDQSLTMSSALEREDRTVSERKREVIEKKINPDQSVLSLYEIGTGDYIGEVHKVQSVTSLQFSFDGSYLAVGSRKGQLTVLAIDENMRENIYEVLDGMKKNPYFWSDFQLDIGEKRLEKIEENFLADPDIVDDLPTRETEIPKKVEVRGFLQDMPGPQVDRELQVSMNSDISRSFVRPPQSLNDSPKSVKKSGIETRKLEEQRPTISQAWNVPVQQEKIPTIRSYVAEKKIQTDYRKKPQPETKATLLTNNLNAERPRDDKISPIMHNISVQAHVDKSKSNTEKTRQYNLEQMDPKKVSINTYKALAEQPSPKTVQEFNPQNAPYSDRAVDKYLDISTRSDNPNKRMAMNANVQLRDIRPDPDDIDDISSEKSFQQNQKQYYQNEIDKSRISNYGNRKPERAPFIRNSEGDLTNYTQTLTMMDDVSNMYDDLSEFEKKFYRQGSDSDFYGGVNYH